jgi:alanyl-tRNA synthetase
MDKYGLNDLRESFLRFFEAKGHFAMPSFSLVPRNDPSLLLINAGMAPLKPYFTGAEKPPCKRVVTCQKCLRTPDIDNVGKTARHGTFFEMLGNFSFGDYFKKEAIGWAWEYFTKTLQIDAGKLYVSVFFEDDEAYGIWKDIIGIDEKKISKLGRKDNFWEHGTGPCGPCSEIYYDRGAAYGCGLSDCGPGCDCDRFIEVWNLVFTQFDKDEKGIYHPLPNPNIDTGMGLERLAMVCQGANSLFEVDTVRGILDRTCELTGKRYGVNDRDDVSIRVITDHIRGASHMIADGILPSNEGRGYVLRRLLRRAARHGRLLGAEMPFLHVLSEKVIEYSEKAYPALLEKSELIRSVIRTEIGKFDQTLNLGMDLLNSMLGGNGTDTLCGEDVFKLHDTYGFPVDLTREIAQEHGKKIDDEGFRRSMDQQKKKAREAFMSRGLAWTKEDKSKEMLEGLHNEFVGYETLNAEARLMSIMTESGTADEAGSGQTVNAVFDKTPFYAESGGQAGDTGTITGLGLKALVIDVKKANGIHIHVLEIEEGTLISGNRYVLSVDKEIREAIMRNHTATHLLHMALFDRMGVHVEQKGSYVDGARLRFDFSHYEPIDKKDLVKIEEKVNSVILAAVPVTVKVMKLEEARKSGAKALFDEKYADAVRVVSVGGYSKELCGGTHVSNSGQIGPFRIVSEAGIASGIRRIEALTGYNALSYYIKKEELLNELASILKTQPDEIKARMASLAESNKVISKELDDLKYRMTADELGKAVNKPLIVNGTSVFSIMYDNADIKTLRDAADIIRESSENSVAILGAVSDGRVDFLISATEPAIARGINAGNMIREVAKAAGGGGGGKASLAQAGGKYPDKAPEALELGKQLAIGILSR